MDMEFEFGPEEESEVVLCGASAYTRKYYLNPDFEGLPDGIRSELKIMCVLYTEEVGGTIRLSFDESGNLSIRAAADEEDILFDEIGSALKIKQMQRDRADLFEGLETFFKVFYLGEE